MTDTSNYLFIDPEGILHADVQYIIKHNIEEIVVPHEIYSYKLKRNIRVEQTTEYCFDRCRCLKKIIFPDSVYLFGKYTFSYCTQLASIKMPARLTVISRGVFMGCKSLTMITLPDTVKELGDHSFNSSGIMSLIIPGSVKTLPDKVFARCKNLKSISLPNGINRLGDGCFYECSALTTINLPDNIREIKAVCFGWCANIREFKLPYRLRKIGNWAFVGCAFESIKIPINVVSIERSAFYACTKLRNIHIDKSEGSIEGAPWGGDKFDTIVHWRSE